MIADVLSTGVFIMGPEAGMALIEKMPDVEGVIVTATNQVLISSGLKGRVETAEAADRRALRLQWVWVMRRFHEASESLAVQRV